jgi:hypothetical protein
MLSEAQREATVRYITEKARLIVTRFGPRPPGSAGEGACQGFVREELEACCDGEVAMEPFPVAQKAFMGFQMVSGTLFLAAFVAALCSPWLPALFSLAALVVVVQQLLRYKLLLDPFFPKRMSHNVHGRIAPEGELRRRVILNGHPDAAYEWRWLYRFPKVFPLITGYTLVGLVVKALGDFACAGLWLADLHGPAAWFHTLHWALLPAVFLSIGFTTFRHVSPGANDNLTGTLLAVGIARQLRAAGLRLKHTELVVAITGSEEAGLRGAKVYVERHAKDWKDVETIALALDTFRDLEHFTIYSRDLNGTVAHDPAVCRLLKEAGAAVGRDLPYGSIFLGSSDGTAFTQGGVRAAALAAMDPAPADYYHNRRDHPDNMDPACLRAVLDVVLEALHRYDEAGLPGAAN